MPYRLGLLPLDFPLNVGPHGSSSRNHGGFGGGVEKSKLNVLAISGNFKKLWFFPFFDKIFFSPKQPVDSDFNIHG